MPLATKESRLIWFNSILEASLLSDDHLDYIQQLINSAVLGDNTPFIRSKSAIPELIVMIAKGDYINALLHDSLYPLLSIVSDTVNVLIEQVAIDPKNALKTNLINALSHALFSWLGDDDENTPSTEHSDSDERQCLLILLGIITLNLFTQVNYSAIPLVIPYTTKQYAALPANEDENHIKRNISMFFQLFSSKMDHGSNMTTDSTFYRHIDVNKTILCNASLKLNGEDTYQCSYYPLFLIISRAIFNIEDVFTLLYSNNSSSETDIITPITYTSSLSSVLSLVLAKVKASPNNLSKKGYLLLPAVLHYVLRSIKAHNDILLTSTGTIRTEFYILSIFYQICYNILNNTQNIKANPRIICSDFTCHPFTEFHVDYIQNESSPTVLASFLNILDAIYYLEEYLTKINFSSIINVILQENMINITHATKKQGNTAAYDSLLLFTYNSLSADPTAGISSTSSFTVTENTIEDVHAVGMSPLSHQHIHASYQPITLFRAGPTPPTLASSLFSTITLELSFIALKLYSYRRCFLLLSLSKLFSGVCIHVSGVMGRRTKYQSRSHAQLSGTSFIHRDVLSAIQNTPTLQFPNSNALINTDTDTKKMVATKYTIYNGIQETIAAHYIIDKKVSEMASIQPEIAPDDDTLRQEKESYKGVINQRNPTIPRVAVIDNNKTIDNGTDENSFVICVTNAGHAEDVPIDTIDDVYLTYMLTDTDNYVVDEVTGKNIDPKQVDSDDERCTVVKASDNLEGVVELLSSFGKKGGGVIFEAGAEEDVDVIKVNPIPPLQSFQPHNQTTMSSLLILSVVSYLYNTTANQSEIAQSEQDCYLQTILAHKYNQTTKYYDPQKNKFGLMYNHYDNINQYNLLSIPYAAIFTTLLYRSILEHTNPRLQVRSISQIELLSNIYLGSEDKLRQIHFQPQYISELTHLYHNTGINNSLYDCTIQKVIGIESMLTFLYDQSPHHHLPHHQYALQYPEEYNALIQQTIRHLVRFRMNKLYTSNAMPWWEVLRTCGDLCNKTGYVSTALKCYVNVQLWGSVVDTLIQIGRRGDATKLLKRVLGISEVRKIDENDILSQAIPEETEDNLEEENEENEKNMTIVHVSQDDDSEMKDGSLLSYITKSMKSSLYTTTTTSGAQHLGLSLSSYRLYYLLGESTQEPQYWEQSWELSGESYAPPQRSLAKHHAVRHRNEEAYHCYQNALALNSNDHQTWYECGVVATRLQHYEKAIPCFTNALRIKPDISEGWNNLAACHLYLCNTPSAYHALTQCIRSKRSSWKIWENYLQCALQLEYFRDVLTAITQISELKGKTDPLTLLPIQYTTQQSKLHVYALYVTWFEYVFKDINSMIEHIVAYNETLRDIIVRSDHVKSCLLCTQYHPNIEEGLMPITHSNMIDTLFPLIKQFKSAILGVIQNISHNESREKDMGGKMRGGGEDAGMGNSVIAQLEMMQRQKNIDDDENATDLNDLNKIDNDKETSTKDKQHKQLMERLSETAKGQKAILNYLLAISTEKIAINDRIDLLSEANKHYEECINILIKLSVENASIADINNVYVLQFILSTLDNAINNAKTADHHIIYHVIADADEKIVSATERTALASQANHRVMIQLLAERVLDGWQRELNMNNKLEHIKPYITQLTTSLTTLKEDIKKDDAMTTTSTASKDPYDSFGDYDPYASYY